ncbi:glutaredoxin family protein [Luteimonas aquatica]|uniref:glutaredoxin family protein n=1 Tax=Luteimonas aquatica TaxID=450364 RepID=UPI001F564C86|nr:glutaredoxin family protein [Luteimonas aquatica]
MKILINLVLVAACLAAGLWAGPHLRSAYDRMFPPPEYVSGDYDALYRQTGKRVVMFSTSDCPFCSRTRALFAREGVDYQDFLIDQSADAKRQYEALGGGGVPLLYIGERRISGYREDTIRQSLALIRRQ